ncbi:preprotein translocase subunit TatC [bacterium]|jgi:sec-independent protein translocase protein TatC|nr:preprotein translocase subunit TatC [bacterium]NBX72558.1 preprotein translocase subunit TatC [bacterium]
MKVLEVNPRQWSILRNLLLKWLFAFLVVNVILLYFYQSVWKLVFLFLYQYAPDIKIISTSLYQPFSLTLKLSLFFSFVITSPYLFYQSWMYIKPALYPQEKFRIMIIFLLLLMTVIFFQILSLCFIMPLTLSFFTSFNNSIVEAYVDLKSLVDFTLLLQEAFLVLSLWPFILYFLLEWNVVNRDFLRKQRGVVYLSSFIIGMFLTPPDVLAQCFFAVPMILGYEIIVFFTRNNKTVVVGN